MRRSLSEIEIPDCNAAHQRLAAIVESSFDAILSYDLSGTITSWNQGAVHLYGYSSEEAIGQSSRMLLPAGMTSEEAKIMQAMAEGRGRNQFESRRLTKSGQVIDVSISLSPLYDESGDIVGTASIQRDISRRRQTEARLQRATKDARQASKAKSEFLANISHELRTPMNAIIGMTALSLHEDLPNTVQDYLTTVKDSADTMLLLINDILDFSRLEAGSFDLDPAPFEIRRLLDETMRALSLRAHEKGLELAAQVHADVPLRIVGDRMRIRQMVTNLVGNAIKFTETGEVVVTVEPVDGDAVDHTEWNVGDAVTLHFCVSDTGIGISPEDQQRVFAPFTQADSSMTRSYAGTGLGLSICRELAELQSGKIWLESEVGKGSHFHFTIATEVAAAMEMQSSPALVPVDKLSGTRVLIVDDNQTTRHILKEMLESWSMVPSTADSAQTAIQQLESAAEQGEGFPLLLVDALMPNIDGIELLRKIEQSTETIGASILMMSPADRHLFRERCSHVSVGAIVEKPVSQSSLLNSIREAVGHAAVVRVRDESIVPGETTLNLLVAEDIPANQKVVSAILQKRGHQVTIAHNGREAIDLCEHEKFDLILMDVQMPVLDGLQATKAIRKLEADDTRAVPIVAMTAHAMRGDREACLAAGMDAYIAKPLDAELLLKTIEQLVVSRESPTRSLQSLFTRSGTWRFRNKRSPTTTDGTESMNSQPITTDAPIWKPEAALKRMGDDAEILSSMVSYFVEDMPDLIQQLQAALDSGDADEARRCAHSLKGLAANLDATPAVKAAQETETLCRDNDLSTAAKIVPELTAELQRLSEALVLWKQEQA